MPIRYALALIVFICAGATRANEPVFLTDGTYRSLLPSAATIADPDMRFDAEAVLALYQAGRMEPVRTPYLNLNPMRGRYWAVFAVRNATGRPDRWVIDLRRPHLLELDVHIERDGTLHRAVDLPRNAAFDTRPLTSRYHGFPLDLAAGETATIVVGYRSFATGWLDPHAGGEASVAAGLAREDTFNWFVNGILVAIIVFAAIMTPVIGRRIAAAFIAYAVAGCLFIAHAEGYLLPLAPGLRLAADRVALLLALVMTLSALALARTLFETHRTQPRADRLYRGMLVLLGLSTLALPFAYGHAVYHGASYAIVVTTSLLHPIIGVAALRQGQAGARPFLVGSPLIVGSLFYSALAHLVPGRFSIERTLDVGQVTLVVEMFAFALAILVRTMNLRRERDAAARRAMTEANARLLLVQALGDSERRYEETSAAAEQAQAKLATIGHDIRQPLLGLRSTLDRLSERLGDLPASDGERMRDAFAYMETVAREAKDAPEVGTEPAPPEEFDLDIVLENAVGMFREEARERGIALDYTPSQARITARPVALMRIVNNLVANAVRHSGGRTVEVLTRETGKGTVLEIRDDGTGMNAEERERAQEAGTKGAASSGDGLGLSIVRELARREGFGFELDSAAGRGTYAQVTLRTS